MPRLGVGMPLSSGSANVAVTLIDDELFLNDVSGEVTTPFTGSRTNKILQSQTFKTTWATNAAAVIPNDLFEAPDNSTTAQAITSNSAGAQVFIQQTVATTAGETYTYSAHVKKAANSFVLLMFSDGTTSRTAYFNAATGAASNTSDVLTTSFDKMDDDWVRVSITFQNTVTTSSSFVRIFSAAAAGSTGTGAAFDAGTELIYVWGAQLEEDSRPSAYIVTTNTAVSPTVTLNDTHDAWDFDVDGDGVKTNDITPQSDPEGEGVWEEATANLVTNHDFSVNANWNGGDLSGTGWSIANNKASNNGTGGILRQPGAVPLNTQFEVVFTVSDYVTGKLQIKFAPIAQTITITGNGTYTTFSDGNNSVNGDLQIIPINSFQGSITNISVKEYAITPLNV